MKRELGDASLNTVHPSHFRSTFPVLRLSREETKKRKVGRTNYSPCPLGWFSRYPIRILLRHHLCWQPWLSWWHDADPHARARVTMPFVDPTCCICPFTITVGQGSPQDQGESPQSSRPPPALLCNRPPAPCCV